jgi:Mg-chelatase subunit ChlD
VHLAEKSRDFCRGLALHEAAHACLTLYHRMLPQDLLAAPGMHTLLNVVEDCRIETWLQARLPGSAPWIREYNDDLFGNMRAANAESPPSSQFLAGLLARWWYGEAPSGMHPAARAALDAATPGLLRAVRMHPPAVPLPGPLVEDAYLRHPAARVFLPVDAWSPPTDEQRIARITQYNAWEVIYREILPPYQRLLDTEGPRGRGDALQRLLQQLAQGHIGDPDARRRGGALARAGTPPPGGQGRPDATGASLTGASGSGAGTGTGGTSQVQQAVERALQVDPRDRYLKVWTTLHAHIDRLSRDVLEVFEKRNRSRITRGHPAGIRITLRAVMQFEAQPILYRRLWEKKSRPQRIDPVMILLIDRSGSMSGDNIARTFEGIVLLSEVAARVGLPLELFTFSNAARHELQWDEGVGEAIRTRLGELPDRCDGGTELHVALKTVRARVAELPFRDMFLVVLSDGATSDAAAAKEELRRIRRAGVRCVGLGLGDGAGAMADLFPGDPVGVPLDQVPDRFMTVLRGFVGL